MSDFYKENEEFKDLNNQESVDDAVNNESVDTATESTKDSQSNQEYAEGSYEWNADNSNSNSEYSYSYVNGNNKNAPHNPNNYESAYSGKTDDFSQVTENDYNQYNNTNNNPYGYTTPNYVNSPYDPATQPYTNSQDKKKKAKKPKKPASKGFVAVILVFSLILSGGFGFLGGYFANNSQFTKDGGIIINKVESSSTENTGTPTGVDTSEIVQKTANSVVEIVTESVVTGKFAQQYVQQGAGSGVIISEDGYIVTNHHVIDGANNIKVTLRDGSTSYTAALIGSDENNDIALLKIDATNLTPATFGISSDLSVGDYVIAIGNPLGELGGTVTDGIISALAREVTIEDKNMTLLQTNAQISPGNSGGGLFNANGELVGIVNAKDSATEVEGIAFAIPIDSVLGIVKDLQSYGYVTGQIDIGMELTNISSPETALYYGVKNTGCYVISVTKNSNADEAGFKAGDLITKVDGDKVASTEEVEKILKNFEVGDEVKFEVYRSGKTAELTLKLNEYIPSKNTSKQTSTTSNQEPNIWEEMFG